MKPRVLTVTPYFVPEGGGLENYAFQVARRLATRAIEITVICHSQTRSSDYYEGIRVLRRKPHVTISNTPIRLSLLGDMLAHIRRERPHLIHAHTPVPYSADIAALASRITRLPLLITYHTSTLFKGQLFFDLLVSAYLPFQYLTLARAQKIVAVTGQTGSTLKRWHQKISVIPPGVDLERFSFQPLKNSPTILVVAPLSAAYPSKGVEVLLHAMPRIRQIVPEVRLLIAGGGELTERFRTLARELGCAEQVTFLGQVAYGEMPQLFAQATLLAVPSIKSEGTPTVILEAQAVGRPVVGTTIGGIPELINNGINGYVVPPNNSTALADRIIDVLLDPAKATALGQAGRSQVEQGYSWDSVAQKYHSLYEPFFSS